MYGDDERYVPFVQRSNQCWRELQEATGTQLLIESGLVLMGTPDSALIQNSEASSRAHALPCDRLEREEISRRWPQLQTDPDMCGLWDASAAILRVEPCIETLLAQAEANGATLPCDAAVETWQEAGNGRRPRSDHCRPVPRRVRIRPRESQRSAGGGRHRR